MYRDKINSVITKRELEDIRKEITDLDDIINVTKAAVRKSILMQIARVRAANRFL
jgi:chorismate mutase